MIAATKICTIARYRLKSALASRPVLYFALVRRWGRSGHLLVAPDTALCIDGFPRSANSFATTAFQLAQSESVPVAHHTHSPANIIRACELGVPVILLIRKPADAAISLRSLALENNVVSGRRTRGSNIPLREHLRAWISFYAVAAPYAERCVVATFDQVVSDFGVITRRVNDRFGREFGVFDHTEESVRRIADSSGYHALPNERRSRIKIQVRKEYDVLAGTRRGMKLLERAERLYEWYTRISFQAGP